MDNGTIEYEYWNERGKDMMKENDTSPVYRGYRIALLSNCTHCSANTCAKKDMDEIQEHRC